MRAFARRLASGQPVGLLLIQDDSTSNEQLQLRTAVEREVADLGKTLELRDGELEELEHEIGALRAELTGFYEQRAAEQPIAAAHRAATTRASKVYAPD